MTPSIIPPPWRAPPGRSRRVGGWASTRRTSRVRCAPRDRPGRPADAPHFARFIAVRLARGVIRPVDGQVRTTLDLELNAYIQGRVRGILERYAAARVTNAAVVVIENATGAVRGWVGSRDFQDAANDGQVDGVLIRRQSASTLKPFLYDLALEKGWTAATLLPDVALVFGSADTAAYSPENFDRRSHGVVRLRTALASSLNVPAVYTLSHVGLDAFLGRLRSSGSRCRRMPRSATAWAPLSGTRRCPCSSSPTPSRSSPAAGCCRTFA